MNRQVKLARVPPSKLPDEKDFEVVSTAIPTPGAGQALTRTIYLSLDPYQWGRRTSGIEKVGDVCHGRTVAEVVESKMDGYAKGDIVFCTNGWQEYGLIGEGIGVFDYMFPRKVDPSLAPISTAVGILGMLGMTAYGGTVLQLAPKPGETVVVSAVSGGVGQCSAQMARVMGAKVVGIAGAPEKCKFAKEKLKLDACVSHKSPTLAADLKAACPNGIDGYFENVGGPVFDAVLPLLNSGSRVSLCGLMAAQSNTDDDGKPGALGGLFKAWFASGKPHFDAKGVKAMQCAVPNFVLKDKAEPKFLSDMAGWVRAGEMAYGEDVTKGLENAGATFKRMILGDTFGKTLVQVGADPTLPKAMHPDGFKPGHADNVLAKL